MDELTHIDEHGRINMVDISRKPMQNRTATAGGFIRMAPETVLLINKNLVKKGDVLTVAELAGIQACKRTSELIPLCHPILISQVTVQATAEREGVRVMATVTCAGQTGVEMEALTAVSVALLTVYDMCKAVDKNMQIEHLHLIDKVKTNLDHSQITGYNE